MTARVKKFCDEYLVSGNATDAAKKAGYSQKTGYSQGQRLLKNAEVSEYLEKRMQELQSAKIASAEEVLQYITSVVRSENEETKDRLKASELLAKRYGMLTDRVNITGAIPVVICGEDDLQE